MSDVQLTGGPTTPPTSIHLPDEQDDGLATHPPLVAPSATSAPGNPDEPHAPVALSAGPATIATLGGLGAHVASWGRTATQALERMGTRLAATPLGSLAAPVAFAAVLLTPSRAGDPPSAPGAPGAPGEPGQPEPGRPDVGIAITGLAAMQSLRERTPAHRRVEIDSARQRPEPTFVGLPDVNGRAPETPGFVASRPSGHLRFDPQPADANITRAQAQGSSGPSGPDDPDDPAGSDAENPDRPSPPTSTTPPLASRATGASAPPAHPLIAALRPVQKDGLLRGEAVPATAWAVLSALATTDAKVGTEMPPFGQMKTQLGVSIGTIRSAYDYLRKELGVVIEGVGARVEGGATYRTALVAKPDVPYSELMSRLNARIQASDPLTRAAIFPRFDRDEIARRGLSVHEAVVESLASGLVDSKASPGRPLASQQAIAEHLQVDHTTVSEAFAQLRSFGAETRFTAMRASLVALPAGGLPELRLRADAWLQSRLSQNDRLEIASSRVHHFHTIDAGREPRHGDLKRHAADELAAGFARGGFRVGDVVPTLSELEGAMGVSRNTVDGGLTELEGRGMRVTKELFDGVSRTVLLELPPMPANATSAATRAEEPPAVDEPPDVEGAHRWAQFMRNEGVDFEHDLPSPLALRTRLFGTVVHSDAMLSEITRLEHRLTRALPELQGDADAPYLRGFVASLTDLRQRMEDPVFRAVVPPANEVSAAPHQTAAMRSYIAWSGRPPQELQQWALSRSAKLSGSALEDPYLHASSTKARAAVNTVRAASLDVADPLLDPSKLAQALLSSGADRTQQLRELKLLQVQVQLPVEALRTHAASLREAGMGSMARMEEREAQTLIHLNRQLDRLRGWLERP